MLHVTLVTCKWLWLITAEVSSLITSSYCMLMCRSLCVFFPLSGCACSVFHHAPIHTNLFHSFACSVSHILYVFFLFVCFIYLFLIVDCNLDYCHHTPTQNHALCRCMVKCLKLYSCNTNLHKYIVLNKDGLTHICMHPHMAFSSIPYLPCSTFFPHTKLASTCSVYFHPQLYILFSVLSNYSSGFLIVHPGWLSASKVPLLPLRLDSSTWGASFSGPGCDADKDKLNRRKRIYIFMTVPILLR